MSNKSVFALSCIAGIFVGYIYWKRTNNKDGYRDDDTKYLCIGGDRMSVGKSTICLGLINSLIKNNIYKSDEIGYIKPATQCVTSTLVARYCLDNNIECIPIGPIIYYKGYTNEIINKMCTNKNDVNIRKKLIIDSIKKLSKNKKLVIIDGVGYISVGSVCRIDNIDIAKMLNAYLMLIIRPGVGDSIDTTNLLLSYVDYKGYNMERLLGVIYNFKSKDVTRHSIDSCKEYVTKYFSVFNQKLKLLGWIPNFNGYNGDVSSCAFKPKKIDWTKWKKLDNNEIKWIDNYTDNFIKYVDFKYIIQRLTRKEYFWF